MNLNLGTTEPKFLALAKTAITNAKQNPTILTALEPFGYGLEKLDEGLSIQNTSEALWNNQAKEKQESSLASLTYKATFDEAKTLISRHRDLARILYKRKPEVLIELKVSGTLPSNYDEFLPLYTGFYTNIKNNPVLQSKVVLLGINETAINDALAIATRLEADYNNWVKERGESQVSTQSKNSALIDLKEWLNDFEDVAKIAFYDNPQTLELLGFFVRN